MTAPHPLDIPAFLLIKRPEVTAARLAARAAPPAPPPSAPPRPLDTLRVIERKARAYKRLRRAGLIPADEVGPGVPGRSRARGPKSGEGPQTKTP
jgi:hypothetical protein